MDLGIDLDFAPMEAKSANELPVGGGYLFEPKWDGFRALLFRDGDEVAIQSKSGQALGRYFPELIAAAARLGARRFVLDGEIVVPVGDRLDFDRLLQRIHPAASRVAMLAESEPATFVAFDLLVDERRAQIHELVLEERRPRFEAFAKRYLAKRPHFSVSPATTDREAAMKWYDVAGGALDGVIAKRLDVPYSSGDRRGMLKVKRMRTADCVIGGYRVAAGGGIGSLLLGLYDGDALEYVGFTSGFSGDEKASLRPKLERLRAEASFEGRVPGGPSRWSRGKDTSWVPVRPELVLEVRFDHVSNGRFRHGTRPLRFRPDKAPRSCTIDQLGDL